LRAAGNGSVRCCLDQTAACVRLGSESAGGAGLNAATEVKILNLENLSGAANHYGGAIHLGPDGKLYIAVSDNANSALSQSITSRFGKILGINVSTTDPVTGTLPPSAFT
jgi:glucose/arabinose dehydrogenase